MLLESIEVMDYMLTQWNWHAECTDLFDLREQVRNNAIEQLQVFLKELGHIGISNGPQHNQLLHTMYTHTYTAQ